MTQAQQQTRRLPPRTRSETDAEALAERDADAQAAAATTRQDEVEELLDETDDWLDSIDEALEEWAASDELVQAFVASYVQKGGQ